ncbi:MAG: GNAT family N-acetyltransferase [Rhodobacteraceae bacterium]|uniref:GNAT family N-acetyltransferase n=1 Tax=Celeribacter sp. HF31 TaxID=2721558 RepID=UPI00142F9EB0|nr:GNAT family N-acetyltransferase [Celeribacter sp. HF31]NIY81105.1 GNAT family N-acetyltransferase [Celeribacter sp. HF31]NVK46379.1 GNAT family N-acetyltransferase [Paracoccaceae bacterium]
MLTIRPLAPEDRAQWDVLWRAYLTFYESELSPEIYDTTFARLTDPAAKERGALVAEKDGELIGLVHYIFHAHNWRIEDVCYLQDLYVSEAARGTGAGRALIEGVYKVADENGTPNVYWTTQHFNETARKLYDRIGDLTPFIKYQRG